MSMTQVKAEMAEEKLERLVIIEEGDAVEGVAERQTVGREAAVVVNNNGGSAAVKKEDEISEEELSGDIVSSEMPLEAQSLPKQHPITEVKQRGLHIGYEKDGDHGVEQRPEKTDNVDGDGKESDGETQDAMTCNKVPEKSTEHTDTETEEDIATVTGHQVDTNRLTSSDQLSMVTESPVGARKQAHHMSTPDFPEALYELLCTLQEGRRLNDQRCSFSLESGFARRRCHSEPNTRQPAKRVMFSSMTSLQKEEFFELVATAQARRLDDQRAELQRSPPQKSRASRFRGSIRQLTIVKKPAALVTVPKEDLYNMILTTQAQGRLEDQRSAAPGPMDDEDFFSLLLRVQGGRMEEQRTELPLKT